jgi:predicted RNA-binding protein YlqC (UPF0109 family)
MAELDQQFIEYVVKNLVDHPDDVKLERSIDDRGVLLELTVNEEDMGRIIGKAGSTAKAIRTLLRVVGAKTDERLNLKIVDVGGDGEGGDVVEDAVTAEQERVADAQTVDPPAQEASLDEFGATEEDLAPSEANDDTPAPKAKSSEDAEVSDVDL